MYLSHDDMHQEQLTESALEKLFGRYLIPKGDTWHHGIGFVEQSVYCYYGELTVEETESEFKVLVVMYDSDGEK